MPFFLYDICTYLSILPCHFLFSYSTQSTNKS